MDDLGLYSLSVILSYLTETEGTSLLITGKRYACQILPLFRLRKIQQMSVQIHDTKRRHRFIVSPVQDPNVLLDRLNTRKLNKRHCRKTLSDGLSTHEIAAREWAIARLKGSDVPSPEHTLLRFLDNNAEAHEKHLGPTLLVSYPRSGNTLMRTLLERVTGRVTGSDTRPDRSLSKELAEQHNLVGEGVTHPSKVLFVKTHWPERSGCRVFEAKRAILLVRNPYDAIDSYWNLNATKSHTKTLQDSAYERFRDKFERLVRNEIHIWMQFHHYWLEEQSQIPVLVVRFEDLVQNPAKQLERVMQFSFDAFRFDKELDLFWKRRIELVTKSSTKEQLGSYRPRASTDGSKSVGKSIKKGRYANEVLDYIQQAASEYPVNFLWEFGYSFDRNSCDELSFGMPEGGRIYGPKSRSSSQSSGHAETSSFQVNLGKPVRPVDCEFGRAMQKWRHGITDTDQNPLPTVAA